MIKCKTKADLYTQWARILRMCEGTDTLPKDCWFVPLSNCEHPRKMGQEPVLHGNPTNYHFAIAIVENKPVFIGDILYNSLNEAFVVAGLCNAGRSFEHRQHTASGYFDTTIATSTWESKKTLVDIALKCGGCYWAHDSSNVVMNEEALKAFTNYIKEEKK